MLNSKSLFGNPNILNVLVESNFTRTSNQARTLRPKKLSHEPHLECHTQSLCRSGLFGEPGDRPKNWKPENLGVSPGVRARESPGVASIGAAWGLGCRPPNGTRGGQSEGLGWPSGRGLTRGAGDPGVPRGAGWQISRYSDFQKADLRFEIANFCKQLRSLNLRKKWQVIGMLGG